MRKFRVVVTEYQSYEIFVEANTHKEAEQIALDNYGCDGEIFNTSAEIMEIDEEESL